MDDDQGLFLLEALGGLTRGLNQGMESRRQRKLEADKMKLKEEDLTLRRMGLLESQRMRQVTQDAISQRHGEDLSYKRERDEEDRGIRRAKEAGDQLRDTERTLVDSQTKISQLNKQRKEIMEDLTIWEQQAKKNPEKWGSQVDGLKSQLSEIDSQLETQKQLGQQAQERLRARQPKQSAPRAPAAPPPQQEAAKYRRAIEAAASPDEAKQYLQQALTRVPKGSPEYDELMKAYIQKKNMAAPAAGDPGVVGVTGIGR